MKVRISVKDRETSAEYSKVKKVDFLRKTILDFMLEDSGSRCILCIDTNNGIGTMGEEEIVKVLEDCMIDFNMEETKPAEGRFMGFAMSFAKKKTRVNKKVFRVVASVNGNTDHGKLYDGLLKHYDYALCYGNESGLEKVVALLRKGVEGVLFNKEVFERTFYDSIVVKRMRVDSEDKNLINLLNRLKNDV